MIARSEAAYIIRKLVAVSVLLLLIFFYLMRVEPPPCSERLVTKPVVEIGWRAKGGLSLSHKHVRWRKNAAPARAAAAAAAFICNAHFVPHATLFLFLAPIRRTGDSVSLNSNFCRMRILLPESTHTYPRAFDRPTRRDATRLVSRANECRNASAFQLWRNVTNIRLTSG